MVSLTLTRTLNTASYYSSILFQHWLRLHSQETQTKTILSHVSQQPKGNRSITIVYFIFHNVHALDIGDSAIHTGNHLLYIYFHLYLVIYFIMDFTPHLMYNSE